jgi:hypothetical protein
MGNIRQARTLALQTALHTKFPLLRSEGCASMSLRPIFYISSGAMLIGAVICLRFS